MMDGTLMNYLKTKYFQFYASIAQEAAEQSVATRHKVGAVVVTKEGMISTGWNGMPSGLDNNCEWSCEDDKGYETGKTKPEVIHAEHNAVIKLINAGMSAEGGLLITTRAPCMSCAKLLHSLKLQLVLYIEEHDDMSGVELLRSLNIPTIPFKQFMEASSSAAE